MKMILTVLAWLRTYWYYVPALFASTILPIIYFDQKIHRLFKEAQKMLNSIFIINY